MSPEQHNLIKKLVGRNEIGPLEDGYQYYWPNGGGAISASQLREIADELDRRNAEWDKQVKGELQS